MQTPPKRPNPFAAGQGTPARGASRGQMARRGRMTPRRNTKPRMNSRGRNPLDPNSDSETRTPQEQMGTEVDTFISQLVADGIVAEDRVMDFTERLLEFLQKPDASDTTTGANKPPYEM